MESRNLAHIVTSLVQINWQAFWLSLSIIFLLAVLQLCRILPKCAYSRWRLGLLLTATLTPFLLCFWTWISVFFPSNHYEAPYIWSPAVHASKAISLTATVQHFVIWGYCGWLAFYPIFVWMKTLPVRRLLQRYRNDAPYWAEGQQRRWQLDVWDDLLRRFTPWWSVRVIEIEAHPPMTVGVFRPVVVIPDGINETVIGLEQPERFRAVMAHELAHIRFHSPWTIIHRLAMWLFPIPELPVWLFNWLRKRFMRLQMDTAQARHFIGVQGKSVFQAFDEPPIRRLAEALIHLAGVVPDPAMLMDVEFELHADFVAVRRGGADPVVLKSALFDALLMGEQDIEVNRLRHRIKSHADFQPLLDAIAKSNGLFGVHHARFMEFPPDKGISLWTKVWKTAGSLAIVHPVAVLLIPTLAFLAERGSNLTRPPTPGFVQVEPAPVSKSEPSVPRTTDPQETASTERQRQPRRKGQINPEPPVVASTSARGPVEIPRSYRTPAAAPEPSAPQAAETASLQAATFNEQQRAVQDQLRLQEQRIQNQLVVNDRTLANIQRQQVEVSRAQRNLDSTMRSQNEMQTTERARQTQANLNRGTQATQQATRQANQTLVTQNSQLQQQRVLQNADRAGQINKQVIPPALKTPRVATPYIPPTAATPPRTYTPSPTYAVTPPRTYAQQSLSTYPSLRTYSPTPVQPTQPPAYVPHPVPRVP